MKIYFTVAEANAMLPLVKLELEKLQSIKQQYRDKYEELQQLKDYHKKHGNLQPNSDPYFTLECEMDFLQLEGNTLLSSFELKGVQLKDIDSGLIDFPALLDGQEVLLCWRQGEDSVAHYHGIQDGFLGRRKLTE
ncbi:DUF2203 family protein [Paenibacillus sp. LMG 31456]|uniref:DUF2203 family protein n=1 Tax=Paenibacillus foliorum TaxID=2654974 RepID=A0A972GJ99_9BACL|nr:DUF2203 domain-containing protein [Paenibacillus foliorum]NOU91826.1 DUF2203 family protein [Paenibacillus foliorum]